MWKLVEYGIYFHRWVELVLSMKVILAIIQI